MVSGDMLKRSLESRPKLQSDFIYGRGVSIVRFYLPAAAMSLCIMPMSMMLAAPPAAPKPSAAPAASPAPTSSAAANADSFAAQAAARHAKRTECLKAAKEKKLVGANRDAYVKDCLGAN
jgi:psiF repeat